MVREGNTEKQKRDNSWVRPTKSQKGEAEALSEKELEKVDWKRALSQKEKQTWIWDFSLRSVVISSTSKFWRGLAFMQIGWRM